MVRINVFDPMQRREYAPIGEGYAEEVEQRID